MKNKKLTATFITATLVAALGLMSGQPTLVGAAVSAMSHYYNVEEGDVQW